MHMPDLSDEELDALFQQGAEGYPEELNLGAWARMEQRLDDARVQQLVNRKVARWFAAEIGIVAVLLLLWGGYREYLPGNGIPPAPAAAARAATQRQNDAASTARPRRVAEAASASQALAVAPTEAAPAPLTAGSATAQVDKASNGAAPAVGPAAVPAGVVPRRKGRLLPPAVTLAGTPDEPGAAAQSEASGTGAAPSATTRRRKNQLTTPLLIAAGRSKSAVGKAGRAAASSETAAAARLGQTATSAPNQAATAASSAGSTATTPASGAAPGTASAPFTPAATGATGNNGPVTAGTEPGAANGTTPAATGAGAATATTPNGGAAAGLFPAETAAAGDVASHPAAPSTPALDVEALQPVSPALLTDALSQLPTALPADSIVRRRARPFVPSRLFITGLYAPELSTVRGAGATRVGHSAGLQIEYLLLPRLRLDVGLLSSMKYYRAHPEDYTPSRTPLYPIEHIDATCRITDIPVSLRYDAWQGVRYRAFGGVGLSSLLMRDEQYRYIYYSTTSTYTRRVKKGSRHLFSVLNLSAGLERQLTPRWSVQAEPYVKLPLGGVGAGKVRLSSGGVFFGLKYGL